MASRSSLLGLSALLALLLSGCGEDAAGSGTAVGPDDGAAADESAVETTPAATQGAAGDGANDASDAPSGDLVGPWTKLSDRGCPPDSVLSYDNFGGPFFLDHCQGCHGGARAVGDRQGAPAQVSFDDVESIREWADRVWLRAADQNASMPPVGPPPAEARTLLGEWLACGAP